MMRALIFLSFFGLSVAKAEILDCMGCYKLEGSNGTAANATDTAPTEPEQRSQPSVIWNGTWSPIENRLGFPPKPDDQNDLKEAEVQNQIQAFPKTRRRRVAKAASNWNPLQTGLGFKEDGNQLNATAVAPLDGSNSTTNSSTVAEQTNPPSGNEKEKTKDHHAVVGSRALPEPKPPQKKNPISIWHPLKNSPGFPPEGIEEQTKQD